MRVRVSLVFLCVTCLLVFGSSLLAQALGPHFRMIKDGIYVYFAEEGNSNCGIIVTQEGVVLVDTGSTPVDSREVLAAVKKLTTQPIRYVVNTEIHGDHTTGNFVFSPPAFVINHEGAAEAMRASFNTDRIERLRQESTEMREAAEGYRLVTPQIEYGEKMTLHLGGRTIEILQLKNVHSEADSAVWLPQERVLFSAAATGPRRFNNIRPFVTIPDILSGIKMMKALNPEIVVPGHGLPGTTQIFDEAERYFGLLMERVGRMVREGKSLDQIQQELRMPEFANWSPQDRLPNNIEAAYRAVTASNN